MMAGVDHIRATHDLARNAFSRGQPAHGAEFADELERLVAFHDASNIAALIVEPMAAAPGADPPAGYLEKLAATCRKHGILLIFDEVISGFGRLGSPFAAHYFNITPDILTAPRRSTTPPCRSARCWPATRCTSDRQLRAEGAIEFLHGYTYPATRWPARRWSPRRSCTPTRGCSTARRDRAVLEQALHSLKGARHVIDIRNLGLVGGIELEPRPGAPAKRGLEAHVNASRPARWCASPATSWR